MGPQKYYKSENGTNVAFDDAQEILSILHASLFQLKHNSTWKLTFTLYKDPAYTQCQIIQTFEFNNIYSQNMKSSKTS